MRSGSLGKAAKAGPDKTPAGQVQPAQPKSTGTSPLRILIADDQELVRAGICELVKQLPEVIVAAQAHDGQDALRLIELHQPDMVLMDIAMPGMNGLDATVLAKQNFPDVKIIVLSDDPSEQLLFRALRLGAEGFVLKDDSVEELQTAIKSVASGARHISPNVRKKNLIGNDEYESDDRDPVKLTGRQRVVLKMIAEGRSTKEIANLLNISINTAKTHRLKLMERLGVHEIAGVVRSAVKLGMIKN